MDDLFDKRSVKSKLVDFMKAKQYIRTSEVIRWGYEHYSNTAERTARKLAQKGLIRRLNDLEKFQRFGYNLKEDVWYYIKN